MTKLLLRRLRPVSALTYFVVCIVFFLFCADHRLRPRAHWCCQRHASLRFSHSPHLACASCASRSMYMRTEASLLAPNPASSTAQMLGLVPQGPRAVPPHVFPRIAPASPLTRESLRAEHIDRAAHVRLTHCPGAGDPIEPSRRRWVSYLFSQL